MMAEAARPDAKAFCGTACARLSLPCWHFPARQSGHRPGFRLGNDRDRDFAECGVRALAAQAEGIGAVAMRSIADAVEGYLAERLSQEELIGATISARGTAPIAIALHAPDEGR